MFLTIHTHHCQDVRIGEEAEAGLLVLGSVRIGLSTYKWKGQASVRFTMRESIHNFFNLVNMQSDSH